MRPVIGAVIGPNAAIQLGEVLRAGDAALAEAVFGAAGHGEWLRVPPQTMLPEAEVARLHGALWALAPDPALMARDAGRRTADYVLEHRLPTLARWLIRALPKASAERLLCKPSPGMPGPSPARAGLCVAEESLPASASSPIHSPALPKKDDAAGTKQSSRGYGNVWFVPKQTWSRPAAGMAPESAISWCGAEHRYSRCSCGLPPPAVRAHAAASFAPCVAVGHIEERLKLVAEVAVNVAQRYNDGPCLHASEIEPHARTQRAKAATDGRIGGQRRWWHRPDAK